MMKKKIISELAIIIALSLIPILWLRDNHIILGHDSGFRLQVWEYFTSLIYSWDSVANFGRDWSLFHGFLLAQLPETIFILLFNSIQIGQTVSFIFYFLLIGLSMYVFIYTFFSDEKYRIFRLFSSIFYIYNFYLLQGWFIAERAKFLLFAALPLGLLILIKVLQKKLGLGKGVVLFSLIFFFLNGGGSPPLYGGIIITYGLAIAYFSFTEGKINGLFRQAGYSLLTVLLLVTGTVFINFYYILPQVFLFTHAYTSSLNSIGGTPSILNWVDVISKNASFINLFRLQGIPDWYDNPAHQYSNFYIDNPFLIFFSFMPISIIILGLTAKRFNKNEKMHQQIVVFLLLTLIVSFIFTMGTHPPFREFYTLLVESIPTFAIFRSAFYKFGPALWFSMVVLTGYFLNFFAVKYIKKPTFYTLFTLLCLAGILVYHYPYVKGNFFDYSKSYTTRVRIPDYVHQTAAYLDDRASETGRILLLPKLDPNFQADGYTWGYWSLDLLPRIAIHSPILANDSANAPLIINELYQAIDDEDEKLFSQLSGVAGIKKVLWRGDVLYSDIKTTGRDLIALKETVQNFPNVTVEKVFGEWNILSVSSPYYVPIIYAPAIVVSTNSSTIPMDGVFATIDTLPARFTTLSSPLSEPNHTPVLSNSSYEFLELKCITCEQVRGVKDVAEIKNKYTVAISEAGNYNFYLPPKLSSVEVYGRREVLGSITDVSFTAGNHEIKIACLREPREADESFKQRCLQRIMLYRELGREGIKSPKITYQKRNATEYVVHIEKATEPFFLNFGEAYDPGWKVYLLRNGRSKGGKAAARYFNGDVTELEQKKIFIDSYTWEILTKNPLDESSHFIANSYANSWYISEEGDFDMVIFYEPQKYFYFGTLITLTTIFLFLILAAFLWRKKLISIYQKVRERRA